MDKNALEIYQQIFYQKSTVSFLTIEMVLFVLLC